MVDVNVVRVGEFIVSEESSLVVRVRWKSLTYPATPTSYTLPFLHSRLARAHMQNAHDIHGPGQVR